MKRVFISGIGVISSIGNSIEENISSLRNSRTGIDKIQYLNTVHKDDNVAAEVKLSNKELKNMVKEMYGFFNTEIPTTRATLLSLIAGKMAIEDARLSNEELLSVPVIGANTIGGMDFTEKHYRNYQSIDPYFFINAHSSGENSKILRDYIGSQAFQTTINTACSSSINSIILGYRLIANGIAKRVLVGGSDALTKFSLNGFRSLMIYDKNQCRPFDQSRDGLNLGEAGAYLVLESEEVIGNKHIHAEVLGFANKNDAFHASASSPDGEGAYLAMNTAMEMAKLKPEDISFVHAHGTATPNNDETEITAIQRIFKDKLPPIASSKAFIGHTLGAAGALNVIYSILCIKESFLFKNLNLKQPIIDSGLITNFKDNIQIETTICNAFGFGGNNSSIIIKKVPKI